VEARHKAKELRLSCSWIPAPGVGRAPNIVVPSSSDYEEAAVTDWLERFDDQACSFTDAVSFAVMSDRGVREALALDHHFAVAGFVVVP
jgi:predicted nucleic acid-binding protein